MWGLEEKEKKALAFSLSGFYNKGWQMNNSCLLIPVNTCITYLCLFSFFQDFFYHTKRVTCDIRVKPLAYYTLLKDKANKRGQNLFIPWKFSAHDF